LPDWSPLLRPELSELTSYVPADPPGVRVRLDANEAPPSRSQRVRDIVARAMGRTALERYPDARARELRAAIAQRVGAGEDELIVGTGSDEIISLLMTALARPRPRAPQPVVLVPTPTFVMYRVTARAHGWKSIEVALDSAWDLDASGMSRAIEMMRPNVVFIASPNNPTGNLMNDDRVEAILRAAPDAVVVVDEAYVDYAGRASLRSWRSRHANLAILRTLSKVGLAALRVGWLEADAELVREIDKARQPFNVSATSQAAASAVLSEGWDEVLADVAAVVADRETMVREIGAIEGIRVTPSEANFVWLETLLPAGEVYAGLLERGVLVRSFHASGGRMARCLRVTIGSSDENEAFVRALREVCSA
jgi:histidinol-phosphate aminotransferase